MEVQVSLAVTAIGISIFALGFFLGNFHRISTITKISKQIVDEMEKRCEELESTEQNLT